MPAAATAVMMLTSSRRYAAHSRVPTVKPAQGTYTTAGWLITIYNVSANDERALHGCCMHHCIYYIFVGLVAAAAAHSAGVWRIGVCVNAASAQTGAAQVVHSSWMQLPAPCTGCLPLFLRPLHALSGMASLLIQ